MATETLTSQPRTPRTAPRAGRRTARRIAWAGWALFLAAFAILEGANHGGASWAALAVGLIAPDLAFLAGIGSREAVRPGQLPSRAILPYNLAHTAWIPLALTAAFPFSGIESAAPFTFLLAWQLHIALDRLAGYTLRGKDGLVRR